MLPPGSAQTGCDTARLWYSMLARRPLKIPAMPHWRDEELTMMIRRFSPGLAFAGCLLLTGIAVSDDPQHHISTFGNENGVAQTFNSTGPLATTGPFFQSLGTNGRSCATCHPPGDNWSV